MDFTLQVKYRMTMKESEKIYKNLELARELKMLKSMLLKVILIVFNAHGTAAKGLEIRVGFETN